MRDVEHIKKYALEMIVKGMSKESVLAYLTRNDFSSEEAEAVYHDFRTNLPLLQQELAQRKTEEVSSSGMAWGALWFFGGIAITIITYSAGGDSYIVAYGPIIYGLIKMVSSASR